MNDRVLGEAPETRSDIDRDALLADLDASTPRYRLQYGALPYRLRKDGQLEFLLVTSRTTRRWIIPKGWPMGERPPHKVAAREALEEAGVEGRIGKRAVGHYHYDKLLANGATAVCRWMSSHSRSRSSIPSGQNASGENVAGSAWMRPQP